MSPPPPSPGVPFLITHLLLQHYLQRCEELKNKLRCGFLKFRRILRLPFGSEKTVKYLIFIGDFLSNLVFFGTVGKPYTYAPLKQSIDWT